MQIRNTTPKMAAIILTFGYVALWLFFIGLVYPVEAGSRLTAKQTHYAKMIERTCEADKAVWRYDKDFDCRMLVAICEVESDLRPYVTGDDGWSHGLCQPQKRTVEDFGFAGSVKDLYNPAINSRYAGRVLNHCFTKWDDWEYAAACYNRGYNWTRIHYQLAPKINYVEKFNRKRRK